MTKYTPRGKIPLGANIFAIFAPTLEVGYFTHVNFAPRGKCVYMTSLPLGVYLPLGVNLPLGANLCI